MNTQTYNIRVVDFFNNKTMDHNNQIEAYLNDKRDLKYQEIFVIEELSKYIGNKKLMILDLACGDGLMCNKLSKIFNECLFDASDISEELIKIANSRQSNNNLNYSVQDCRSIAKTEYDLIIASGILSVFEDWEMILDQWMHLLKNKGSLFLFGGFNPNNIDVKLKFRNNYMNDSWQTGLDIISIETLKKYCKSLDIGLYNIGEFRPPIEIKQAANPIRGYTIKDFDDSNLVVNGALQIRRFFLFRLEKK